ncbi:MAG: hypothetical protein HUJ22_02555 [Gracilimonas sp.]|uniref:GDSL-type esterase/lipase family protein n=1 Tax=Gracilimonas sp. TaxID=1974203 RepID=UPI0019B83474|nr:GDSL-type esterase/lipase family protein [Gracilimonas sp.]MBD3615426.1 hypothetical protein [Gracilimonas sp.]
MNNCYHIILFNILLMIVSIQCDSVSNSSSNTSKKIPLDQPLLQSPDSASTIQSTSTSLSWLAVSGAEKYTVQITGTKDFDSVLTASVTSDLYFEVDDLSYNKTFFWRARALNEEGMTGPWSESWLFTTPKKPEEELVTTSLQSPGNGWEKQETDLTLKWDTLKNAVNYRVQVSMDSEFLSLRADTVVNSNTYHLSQLSFKKTYFWRVKPILNQEDSKWSKAFSFTTKASDEDTDITKPKVNISGSHFEIPENEILTLTANASDDSGISSLEIYVDETLVKTCSNSSSCSHSADSYTIGSHSYYSVATDASSNVNKSQSETKNFEVIASVPENKTVKIMPLGDSITEAFGYRLPLWNMLTGNGYSIDYVGSQSEAHPDLPDTDHEGHGGWTIDDISAEVNGWLLTYQPDVVLLMIGTNDIAWWTSLSANQIADKHAHLVDQISNNISPEAWILVGSIPPQSSEIVAPINIDRSQLTIDFNQGVKERMQQRIDAGRNIIFVDIHSQLTLAHLADGIHPNEEGYKIIAETWYEALLPVLP